MNFIPVQTTVFEKGEDLFAFFCNSVDSLSLKGEENTVCIISSKLVALAQGRKVNIEDEKQFEKLIETESEKIFSKTQNFFLTKAQGIVIPNGGIDRSNTQKNTAILWPKDTQAFADDFRKKLQKKFSITNLGVVISDSRITPLRQGTVGIAIAWSGFFGVYDLRGEKDIYGNILKVSTVNIADNVVSASEILMGQGSECIPFVVCKNFPEQYFTNSQQLQDFASIDPKDDLFSL